jgi:hypothetical protein
LTLYEDGIEKDPVLEFGFYCDDSKDYYSFSKKNDEFSSSLLETLKKEVKAFYR